VHGDHVLRDAAHVGGAQPFTALEQQSRANEQDHSQPDFERKQHLAQVARALPPPTDRDDSCSAPRIRLSLLLNAEMSPENSAHSTITPTVNAATVPSMWVDSTRLMSWRVRVSH
jgi:hypothetical protein